jgi:hypothetical protein
MQEALDALVSDELVEVRNGDDWITFTPLNSSAITGFIFYPGGNVEPEAYSIVARGIAEQGFFVSIIKFPFDLAFFAPKKGGWLFSLYPNITSWFIGGHSLGGAMAARFVYDSSSSFSGLVLLASYPGASKSLANTNISVLSIYASRDGIVRKAIPSTAYLLPTNRTLFIEIVGGNHANFGSYGTQKGDLSATISRTEQQNQTITKVVDYITNESKLL